MKQKSWFYRPPELCSMGVVQVQVEWEKINLGKKISP